MYKARIEKLLVKAVVDLGFVKPTDTVLSIPEKSQFGDYSSNVALQLSKQEHKNSYQKPLEIANAIIEALGHPKFLERVELAGPGFLNFFIKDEELAKIALTEEDPDAQEDLPAPKTIIVEYCDPNTHKMLHIGHLLQLTLGETLSRLYEYQGHEVIRTNYGSDIGLTVAKCLWGIENPPAGGGEIGEVREESLKEKAQFLGKAYAFAHAEYEKSLEVKEEIDQITNKLYQRDAEMIPLWEETKNWSLGYFETIYSIFGTLFDRRINESEVDQLGKQIVLENVGKVFVKDDGAIIYPGEKYGLHNRVFINSKGNPTYEGKEVGLADKYIQTYQFDELNIFSHKEQDDYFKVVIRANGEIFHQLKGHVHHVSYGEVKLSTGKMSSRMGNIIAAEDIFNEVKFRIKAISPQLDELSIQKLAVAAIKFAFLKYSPKSDIIYDLEESVSIHGDTGPYVMYVYARIQSLLKKASKEPEGSKESEVQENRAKDSESEELTDKSKESEIAQGEEKKLSSYQAIKQKTMAKSSVAQSLNSSESNPALEPEEREILRQLEYFEFIAQKAANNFQPNEMVKYLLNLTKAFNLFYESQPVLGSKNQDFRVTLSIKTAETIKLGLYLLGIETVDKM